MNFPLEEFKKRINDTKLSMNEKSIEVLVCTDPSNMYYLTGYDGWSFYVPQAVIVSLDSEEPIWIGRKQDANGAKVTTFLNEENILGYPEKLIQCPPDHPFDFITNFFKKKNWANKNIGVEMDSNYYTAETHHRLTSQ